MGIKSVNYPFNVPVGQGEFVVSRADCGTEGSTPVFRGEAYSPDEDSYIDLAEIARNDIGTGNIEIPNLISGESVYGLPQGIVRSFVTINNRIFAGLNDGKLAVSTDGQFWETYQPTTLNISYPLYDGVYNGIDTIVFSTQTGVIVSTDNGDTWQYISIASGNFQGIAYGNGYFVIAGQYAQIFRSQDGLSWQMITQSSYSGDIYIDVTFGNSKFFVCQSARSGTGRLGDVLVSTDNAASFTVLSNIGRSMYSIEYGNGILAISSGVGLLYYSSDDGQTWNNVQPSASNILWNDIKYINNNFIFSGSSGYVGYTTNFEDAQVYKYSTDYWYAAAYFNNKYIIGGYGILSGEDIANLQASINTTWYAGTSGNGVYVVAGASGIVAYSNDGVTFNTVQVGSSMVTWRDIIFQNGTFVLVGSIGSIATSTNGSDWNYIQPINDRAYLSITYGNGIYLITGSMSSVTWSYDLINWNTTYISSNIETAQIYDSTFDGERLLIYGNNGVNVQYSIDAVVWNKIEGEDLPIQLISGNNIEYADNTYVLGGGGYLGYTDDIFAGRESFTIVQVGNAGSVNDIEFNSSQGLWYVATSNGHVLVTQDFESFDTINYNNSINKIYAQGSTLIILGNYIISIITIDYGAFINDSELLYDYYLNGTYEETFAYDYNMRWISDIGDNRLNSDTINNLIQVGQYATLSAYDILCNNPKTISVLLNGSEIVSDMSQSRSLQFWVDTLFIDAKPGDILSIQTAIGDNAYNVDYEFVSPCNRYVVYYLNKFGAVDPLLIRGKSQEAYTNDQFMINTNYDRSTPASHQYKVVQNTGLKNITLNTGDLTDAQSEKMYHLMPSPKVWLHDLQDGIIYSAYITNPSFTVNKRRVNNTTLNNYTFNLTIAQDIIRRG